MIFLLRRAPAPRSFQREKPIGDGQLKPLELKVHALGEGVLPIHAEEMGRGCAEETLQRQETQECDCAISRERFRQIVVPC